MLKIEAFVENWPKSGYVAQYTPIGIALLALAVSVYSAYFTQVSFVVSQRPYVWAISYSYLDDGRITSDPSRIAFRVKNSPARISRQDIRIEYNAALLHSYTMEDEVRFPDDRSEWSYTVGVEKFRHIMDLAKDPTKLARSVVIHYSSLDGGKTYTFEIVQTFDPNSNQWKDVKSVAN